MEVEEEVTIHGAAERGDIEAMARLLDETDGDLLNVEDYLTYTPLHRACLRGHVEAVRFLLDRGADINRIGRYCSTPLWLACFSGRMDVVALLLERGADPTPRHGGMTVLMGAATRRSIEEAGDNRADLVRLLLKDGRVRVCVNDRGWRGKTALWVACSYGFPEVARVLLLEGGADHTLTGENGRTPMAIVQRNQHEGCVELLQWFEGELERCYCLAKAWHVNDDREAIRPAPIKAEARTAEEVQRAREEAAPEYVRGRVVRGEALPSLEVVMVAHGDEEGGGGSGKRNAMEEEEEVVVRAVLQYVLMGMKEEPFIALMELMRYR